VEEKYNVHCITNINSNNAAAVNNVNNNQVKYIKKSLSTPKLYNNTNNKMNTPAAVNFFDHSAKALGMSSRQSVTNGKVGQPAKRTPVLSNADSGATGNYIRLADINVLRDVRVSSPAEQIAVAVADGNLLKSTHHGFLDVPGHGAMIAYVFPQLHGSLLSISKLVNFGLKVLRTSLRDSTSTTSQCSRVIETSKLAYGWLISGRCPPRPQELGATKLRRRGQHLPLFDWTRLQIL